jgi:filamin/ABP280 repeat protein/Big-like domain-containing protein
VKPAVLVRDAGGTPVAGLAVTFAVVSGGGSIEGGSATTGADGVATAGRWTLGAAAGPNTLQATVAADGVSGNPVSFTATGVVGAPSPDQSTVAAAPGTIAASQGSAPSTITVTVRDAAGNPLAAQPVALAATGAGVSLTQPGSTDGSGTTTAVFSATGAGPHTITATTGSITLGSTTVTVSPGAPDPSRVSVSVPSGTAGSATQVQMTLQDQFGNPVVGAAGQISVSVSGANAKGSLPIVEQGGGRYSATYTPVRVGTDQVDVRVGGTPVPGSPFTSAVLAGASDPLHTTADVPDGALGQQLEIIVHVNDGQDNPVGHGGDHVTVTVNGLGLAVEDRGDGTYRATWTPFVVGKFPVVITLNGAGIKGSPYATHIRFF